MTIRRQSQILLPLLLRTHTANSPDFSAQQVVASIFTINVSAIMGNPSVTLIIKGKDPISGEMYPVIASDKITTTGRVNLQVPSHSTKDEDIQILPSNYRVTVEHDNTSPITYSVGATHMVDI